MNNSTYTYSLHITHPDNQTELHDCITLEYLLTLLFDEPNTSHKIKLRHTISKLYIRDKTTVNIMRCARCLSTNLELDDGETTCQKCFNICVFYTYKAEITKIGTETVNHERYSTALQYFNYSVAQFRYAAEDKHKQQESIPTPDNHFENLLQERAMLAENAALVMASYHPTDSPANKAWIDTAESIQQDHQIHSKNNK